MKLSVKPDCPPDAEMHDEAVGAEFDDLLRVSCSLARDGTIGVPVHAGRETLARLTIGTGLGNAPFTEPIQNRALHQPLPTRHHQAFRHLFSADFLGGVLRYFGRAR
jgi:hypothetical protein